MKKMYQKTWKQLTVYNLLYIVLILGTVIVANIMNPQLAIADTAAEIDRDVNSALQKLYSSSPAAKELSTIAKGILVFPDIIKGGLIVGGQYGVGALREGGKTVGYYRTVAASYGLQIGAQKFGYVMFFITQSALDHLEEQRLGDRCWTKHRDRGCGGCKFPDDFHCQEGHLCLFLWTEGTYGGDGIAGFEDQQDYAGLGNLPRRPR
jgi:hypothetical protein